MRKTARRSYKADPPDNMKSSLNFRKTSAHFPVNVKLESRLKEAATTHSKG
jgi:hypothetical protein